MRLIPRQQQAGFGLRWVLLVLAVAGFVLLLSLNARVRKRGTAGRVSCNTYVQVIQGAKDQWALETKAAPDASPTQNDLRPYMRSDFQFRCPDGGTYQLGRLSELPRCSLPAKSHGTSWP